MGAQRGKTRAVACDADTAAGLAAAIRAYTDAAYPRGGSDCAQVARAALLDVADQCAAHPGGALPLRRRVLPQLRAAVRWYLSADGPSDPGRRPALEKVLTELGSRGRQGRA